MSELDILIVDDEPVVVRVARKVLEPEGLTLDATDDGDAVRERLRRNSYRTVLLDLMIPGVAGLELLERVRTDQPDTPVIVTTGYATAQTVVAVLKAGAFDFLPKPFDDEELLGVVRRSLRHADRVGHDTGAARGGSDGSGSLRCLGVHSWARLDEDGLATLGVTEAFAGSIEGVLRVRLPGPGDETVQGLDFAAVESSASGVHRIWAPLSGQVVESNEVLRSDCEPIRSDPLGRGWLARVTPWDREEANELTVR